MNYNLETHEYHPEKLTTGAFLMSKKIVCVDLDGTLAKYDKWEGIHKIGEPFEGAKEWTKKLSERYGIVIFTVRTNWNMNNGEIPKHITEKEDQIQYLRLLVEQWLLKNDITYDIVYTGQGKPSASIYFDDRGITIKDGIYPEM